MLAGCDVENESNSTAQKARSLRKPLANIQPNLPRKENIEKYPKGQRLLGQTTSVEAASLAEAAETHVALEASFETTSAHTDKSPAHEQHSHINDLPGTTTTTSTEGCDIATDSSEFTPHLPQTTHTSAREYELALEGEMVARLQMLEDFWESHSKQHLRSAREKYQEELTALGQQRQVRISCF